MLHNIIRSSCIDPDLSDTRHAQQIHNCSCNHHAHNGLPSRTIHRSIVRNPRRDNHILRRQFLPTELRLRHRDRIHCRTAVHRQKNHERSHVFLVLGVFLFLPVHRTFLAFSAVNLVPNNRPPNTNLSAWISGNQQREDQQQSEASSFFFHNFVNINSGRTDFRISYKRAVRAGWHPSTSTGRLASVMGGSHDRLSD